MSSILRFEDIGGGSAVVDYKNHIVTFEEEVDATQLSNYEIRDKLQFDIIWRGIIPRRAKEPYHDGHGVGIRMKDGWLLNRADLFVNCILMDYINVLLVGDGERPVYIEGQRVEYDNYGRILLGPDQNQMAWIQIMKQDEDYQVTFIGVGILDLNTYKSEVHKNQGLYVPINYGV